MCKPEEGISCPGCPHRAAFVAVKEAVGRGRGRVYCGDAGCSIVGPMHPAACACPGGEATLRDRYRQQIPNGSAEQRALVCAHFVRDTQLGALDLGDCGADTPERASSETRGTASPAAADAGLDHLAQEGDTVLLCVLASSRAWLGSEALSELERRARALGAGRTQVLDPFDTLACQHAIERALAQGGVSALIFQSPCVQLQRGERTPAEIDRFACSGCQRCAQITGCPALTLTPPVLAIDADACAGCDLCADYCRTNIIYSDRQRLSPAERHIARMEAAGFVAHSHNQP